MTVFIYVTGRQHIVSAGKNTNVSNCSVKHTTRYTQNGHPFLDYTRYI